MLRRKKPKYDFADLVPLRKCDHETDEEGHVVLLKPRFGWGPLKRYLLPRLKSPYVRITLDDIGTHAWNALDGRTTVGDIARDLAKTFADPVTGIEMTDALGRLTQFLMHLHRHGLIGLLAPQDTEHDRSPN